MTRWMRRKQEIKLNNKGISLVELLVAITILSIISVVVFQGFILSARTNSKAKIQHKATSLAQNILEGMKAENTDDIKSQFTTPFIETGEGAESVSTLNFDILPMQLMNVADVSNPTKAELQERVGAFSTGVESKYQFWMNDVKLENTLFDVLITLDGTNYKGAAGIQSYNEQETIRIPNMDMTYDALVSNSNSYDTEGFDAVQKMVGTSYNPSLAYRRITVTIDDTPILNPTYPTATKVTAKYEYFYSTNPVPSYTKEDVVFDSAENPEYGLRNVFLFFTPSYGHKADEIIIDNSDNRELELYLIKQQTNTNLVQLAVDESMYNISLTIREKPVDLTAEAEAFLKLRTNLGVNLGNGTDISLRETYKYRGDTTSFEGDIAKKKLDYNSLTNGQKTDNFYDVKIEVYLSDTEEVPTSIDDFSDPVALITGSVRN